MRRLLVVGLSGIAVLAIAGVAFVAFMTTEGARRDARPVPQAAAPEPAPLVPPPATPPPATGVSPVSLAPAPIPTLPASEAPPPESWEAVPPAAVPASLGPVGGAVARGIADVRERLATCWDEYEAARHGTERFTVTRDGGRGGAGGAGGQAVLMLQLETADGSVRIVDAPVDVRGGASDGVLACAQRVLRGRSLPAPGVRAGERYRLRWGLQP